MANETKQYLFLWILLTLPVIPLIRSRSGRYPDDKRNQTNLVFAYFVYRSLIPLIPFIILLTILQSAAYYSAYTAYSADSGLFRLFRLPIAMAKPIKPMFLLVIWMANAITQMLFFAYSSLHTHSHARAD